MPVVANPGNVGASFAVLSYAGELAVVVVTGPALVPDDDTPVTLLTAGLDAGVEASGDPGPAAARRTA